MSYQTKNVYYIALYRKNLLTPGLETKLYFLLPHLQDGNTNSTSYYYKDQILFLCTVPI